MSIPHHTVSHKGAALLLSASECYMQNPRNYSEHKRMLPDCYLKEIEAGQVVNEFPFFLLDALSHLVNSWNKVTIATIQAC